MIRCKNVLAQGQQVYESGVFCREKWERYIELALPGSKEMLLADVQACLDTGKYTWEKDFLPVLQAVPGHPELKTLTENFRRVTCGLDSRVTACFGKTVDADVVLYLGLLNGAGWVTEINGRMHVLLGAEKILELGWQGLDEMRGLVWHELGHVFQAQHGRLCCEEKDRQVQYVYQLFTEGVAMVFEQTLASDEHYFHQNKNGWLAFCEARFPRMLADFALDLPAMASANQRWFGDWARYEGVGDAGYYLGVRFVRDLIKETPFQQLIGWDEGEVYRRFLCYVQEKSTPG